MDIWNNLIKALSETQYYNEYLRIVLRRWYKIMGEEVNIPASEKKLSLLLENTVIQLEQLYEKQGLKFLFSVLRCMLIENYFGVDDLNTLLSNSELPYYYVGDNNDLQKGNFKRKNIAKQSIKNKQKYDRIFISHSSKDTTFVDKFVDFLKDMGVKNKSIFYSSMAEYGVENRKNINDTIRKKLANGKPFVIFMLSKNFFESIVCVQETGATWGLQHDYQCFLLPGYSFKEINSGVLDVLQDLAIKLDCNSVELLNRLVNFRNDIQNGFNIKKMDEREWNRKVNGFMEFMNQSEHLEKQHCSELE